MLPLPSTLLKTWSNLTRWLLAAVLLAWLLLGVAWSALHWVIVPRISEFRPLLEARATQALGVPVRIGAMTAQSNGAVPSFELTDVALIDALGREALVLPRVLVAISPRSLWRLGFEQLYIDQPRLDIRRAPDGRISMGGLDFSNASGRNMGALDWFFSQVEFAIHDGTVRWTDEQRGAEPVVLQKVDFVMRNVGRHHDMRLDATPPAVWGERFGVRGRFLQPRLARQNGQWERWDGQIYAAFDRIDLSALRHYADLGVDLSQGTGAVRAWVDVGQGQFTGVLTDVALSEVRVTLGPDLQALDLHRVQGRIGGRPLAGGFEFFTQALTFDAPDGLHWPGGNVRVTSLGAEGKIAARGEIEADQLDLAALVQIANRLPLDAALREQLLRYSPKGRVDTLVANWQGPITAPDKYTARGRASQLEWAAVSALPGVRGLAVDFDLDQQAGRATLALNEASVDLPEIFQERVLALDQLSAEAKWQVSGQQIAVQLANITFRNADAQGVAQIKWQTSDPVKSASRSRFPGVLDLQATLSRAEGRRVHRYLPLVIDQDARDYVRDAVTAGTASNVRFLVKGDINLLPEIDPRQGSFRISADVQNAKLLYVPPSLQQAQDAPWPALVDLSGELVIDRMQLQVKNARARLGDDPAMQVIKAEALIPDLNKTQVNVTADIKGPLPGALRLVNGSPLGSITGQALAQTVATGNADYKLKLVLPVANIEKSTVQGSVILAGNDLQITADTPRLTRARGAVNFTQTGFSLAGVQARMLGGDAKMDGGLLLVPDTSVTRAVLPVIRATGTATAEGLRQATELGFVSRLAHQLSGAASYSATLGLRRGVPELLVSSDLAGMASSLPQPLAKDAQSVLPLRLQTALRLDSPVAAGVAVKPLQDRLTLTLGRLASAVFERDLSGAQPQVVRGAIGVGADTLESVVLPERGVTANLNLSQFNVDAWSNVLVHAAGTPLSSGPPSASDSLVMGFLPTSLAVRSDLLTFGARQFSRVVLGGSRDGLLWRANLDARELNGYLEYRLPADSANASAGRLYARLARLTITPTVENDVEALLDAQPTSIPALDIVVDELELAGKRLGWLEIEAINRTTAVGVGAVGVREWRLNKFNLIVPEATLTATGNWARLNAQSATAGQAPGGAPERRRTVMNFKLDILDGGALLSRFGMKDVVRQASGRMEGQIAWMGSPLRLDYPTLGGAFTVNVASGQFLKADPGIAKLLGVLSLQALPRRLTLDFRDVFSDGFAFDFLRGEVTVDKGIARTNNLQMKGINAAVLMEGQADIALETQDIKVVVVPELNAGTASLIATVINPAVGLGTFLAQMFLRRPLSESATQEFHIDGSWADPRVTKVSRSKVTNKETSR